MRGRYPAEFFGPELVEVTRQGPLGDFNAFVFEQFRELHLAGN